jgi:hypothetical protein
MVVVPAVVPAVANPYDELALLIVATVVSLDVQTTVLVRSCVEPSVYVPVAVNCSVVLMTMLGAVGVMAIDTKVAAVTVSGTLGETMLPEVAVIFAVPAATLVARPLLPEVLLIVATVVVSDAQVTLVVMF